MDLCSQDQIEQITGKTRPAAQRRALDRMGIRYFVRPDGRPVVVADALRDEVEPARTEPDWSVLFGGSTLRVWR